MERYLRKNGASIAADLFRSKILPVGTVLYVPTDVAFDYISEMLGMSLDELQELPVFSAIIANHINAEGFKKNVLTIDGIPILLGPVKFGPVSVYIINGVLATPAQSQMLKPEVIEVETMSTQQDEVVINPKTGRTVKVGGKVYKDLVDQGLISETATRTIRQKAQPRIPKSEVITTDKHLSQMKALPRTDIKTVQAKGWGAVSPRRGTERDQLKEKCGDACFLLPQNNGYPICPKLSETNNECMIDCRGLAAAKTRARFLPNEYRDRIIPELQKHHNCK